MRRVLRKGVVASAAAVLLFGGALVFFAVRAGSMADVQQADASGASAESQAAAVTASNSFAQGLYGQLKAQPGNLCFSPYSLGAALAMTYEGARGQTASEIATVLPLSNDATQRHSGFAALHNALITPRSDYKLSVANSLWAQQDYPFLPAYTDGLKQYYAAGATNVDFSGALEPARKQINDWVSDHTQRKIAELFKAGSLDDQTRLVLANAIYFKGAWVYEFDKGKTQDRTFFAPAGGVQVPTMHLAGKDSQFGYAETPDLQALELPYKGERLSMLILLPRMDLSTGKTAPLSAAESQLASGKLVALRGGMTWGAVDVSLPRFKFARDYDMVVPLSSLGMPTAFSMQADFSGMDGSKQLFLGAAVHQAVVEVNEEGTEAAAASGMGFMVKSKAPSMPLFVADHPFVFAILDRASGLILFLGRVENPVA